MIGKLAEFFSTCTELSESGVMVNYLDKEPFSAKTAKSRNPLTLFISLKTLESLKPWVCKNFSIRFKHLDFSPTQFL